MTVVYKAMRVVVGPLQKCKPKTFFVPTRDLVEWKCAPLLIFCCCHIPEGRDMSAVRHAVVVKRPCIR